MDFVIVGPEKTGTGWFDSALREHMPAALPAVTKETFYLDRLNHLGPRWHEGLYRGGSPLRGEVSPSYFAHAAARERLQRINPNARVIIVLRDPYARMASHLLHLMRRGVGDRAAPDLGLKPALWERARDASRYRFHGEAWRRMFGEEAVAFVCYDDIRRRPAALLRDIASHIGARVEIDDAWANDFSNKRVFESAAPSSPRLAQLAYFVSRRLQDIGATQLVAAARRSGVRKLFERQAGERDDTRAALERRLREREDFEDEIDFAQAMLSRTLEPWRSPQFTPLADTVTPEARVTP
jgi:hypothetical protein